MRVRVWGIEQGLCQQNTKILNRYHSRILASTLGEKLEAKACEIMRSIVAAVRIDYSLEMQISRFY